MKKILILKAGSTIAHAKERLGDFEDWIIRSAFRSHDDFVVFDCQDKTQYPAVENFTGIIITGSHANVTDDEIWMNTLMDWLREASTKEIPILGICFGHQILAASFGGVVDFSPNGLEIGTHTVELTDEAQTDFLFMNLPGKFPVNESHAQEVRKLPENARLLAGNQHSTVQAMVIGNHIWGVQFHPEFGKAETQIYFDARKTAPTQHQENNRFIDDTPVSRSLLQRFADLSTLGLGTPDVSLQTGAK